MSISDWTLRADGTYERLLGLNEVGFYWDSVYRGTADSLQHAVVEETGGQEGSDIQNETNVRAAWVALKMQYPLLGARIEERHSRRGSHLSSQSLEDNSNEEVYFIVSPARLSTSEAPHAHPREVVFLSCSSAEEAEALEEGINNGFGWKDVSNWQGTAVNWDGGEESNFRILSNTLPACMLFIRRLDRPSTFHVMFCGAHLITDGMGNSTMLSGFLDLLSRRRNSVNASMEKDAFEKRLKLSVASEALYPDLNPSYSRAKRRWNRVLGKVLLALRSAKINGGHTLPRILRPSTLYTPAKSSNISYAFTAEQTATIFRKCKSLGITFGNAHPVLGQIALTRVLLRRRLRTLAKRQRMALNDSLRDSSEDIDDAEWTSRRHQPMITGGPANLRPYLDKQWYKNGGAGNISLSISFFFFTLPFMPLGDARSLVDGNSANVTIHSGDVQVPAFSHLLSHARFRLRCNMIKAQSARMFNHPRFLDIGIARLPGRIQRTRELGLAWRDGVNRFSSTNNNDAPIPPLDQPKASGGMVLAHGGSSFGNADLLVPPYYPSSTYSSSSSSGTSSQSLKASPSSPSPTLYLIRSITRLCCRPTELYLGAATSRGQLRLNVFWDENVYRRKVIEEWLDEVVGATEWFLCGGTSMGKENVQVGTRVEGPIVSKL